MSYSRRIAASYLLYRGEMVKSPIVEVDSSGVILSIEFNPLVDSRSCTEFYSGVLIPGFVNAHTHLELSYMKGHITPNEGFARFASSIHRLRASLGGDKELIHSSIRRADIEMYNAGVAAVCDIANSADALPTKESSPIEYHTFVEIFGLSLTQESPLPALQGVASSYTPHSLYSLQDHTLRKIVDQSGDFPLSIHFMESEAEREFYHGKGDIYNLFVTKMGQHPDFLHHGSPAQRLVNIIPANRKVILIHNTFVTEQDIDLITSHFTTPPTWVLSPRSNRYITGAMPPIDLLRSKALDIALGTDSLASNSSLNPLHEISLLEDVPLQESLTWATQGGANAMGLAHLGQIEVGMRPSLNILSGIDYNSWRLTPHSRVERIV
ncbi:MAG: amidohydrolase family protein [Rikenellaceae bacterium]